MEGGLRNLFIAVGLYTISMFVGIIGYIIIEDYNFVDALYMTVITLSTVGFGEIYRLSDTGKIFTSIFILYNLLVLAFIVSVISRYLFEGGFKEILSKYKSQMKIDKLENHVIVCGYGRNGQRACEELERDGYKYVVIDPSEETIIERSHGNKINYIVGDAVDEEVLQKAHIDKAKALITAIPRDSINVFVTLTARELNKDLFIIARATNDTTISKLKTAGANKVVLPDAIGGRYMADLVSKPQVLDFLDTISGADGDLNLVKLFVSDLKPEYKNKSIEELQVRSNSGVNILGIKKPKQNYIFNPPADLSLGERGVLMILGKKSDVERFKKHYYNPESI